jgi:hypothetical protein
MGVRQFKNEVANMLNGTKHQFPVRNSAYLSRTEMGM